MWHAIRADIPRRVLLMQRTTAGLGLAPLVGRSHIPLLVMARCSRPLHAQACGDEPYWPESVTLTPPGASVSRTPCAVDKLSITTPFWLRSVVAAPPPA